MFSFVLDDGGFSFLMEEAGGGVDQIDSRIHIMLIVKIWISKKCKDPIRGNDRIDDETMKHAFDFFPREDST